MGDAIAALFVGYNPPLADCNPQTRKRALSFAEWGRLLQRLAILCAALRWVLRYSVRTRRRDDD